MSFRVRFYGHCQLQVVVSWLADDNLYVDCMSDLTDIQESWRHPCMFTAACSITFAAACLRPYISCAFGQHDAADDAATRHCSAMRKEWVQNSLEEMFDKKIMVRYEYKCIRMEAFLGVDNTWVMQSLNYSRFIVRNRGHDACYQRSIAQQQQLPVAKIRP